MLKLAQFSRHQIYLPCRLLSTTAFPSSSSSFLIPSSYQYNTTSIAAFSYTSVEYAKKQKRNFKKQQKIEIIDVDEDDDDDPDDDVIDEKTALKAKGILHKGVGEAEEIVDDGLPKDYKHRSFKLTSRRLDTILNRTSGKSSAEVEKMILSGCVKINDQIEKKKAYNVSKRDDIEVWLEPHPENPLLANALRIKILNYVLKQHGYDIECQIWSQQLIENWRHSESSGTPASE
jgi:hypothetical protein